MKLNLINFLLFGFYGMYQLEIARHSVLIHVIMIIRDSNTPLNEEKEWLSLQHDFFRNFTGYKNVMVNIHLTRIKLDYGSGYNPVGGTWYILNKIKKFRKLYNRMPAFIVSNSINQEIALLATELKIPLIGCSQEYDIPLGLGIQQPIWVASSPFDEYVALKNAITKRGHSGCVIFIVLSKLAAAIFDMLTDAFQSDLVLIVNEMNIQQFHLNKELRVRRIFLVIPYENVSLINYTISILHEIRSKKPVVLLPQNLFEEIIVNSNNPLKKILNDCESYVSKVVNFMSETNTGRNCLRNSISIIADALTKTKIISILCKGFFLNCFSRDHLYQPKLKILKDHLKKIIEEKELKINTIYFNVILKFKDFVVSKKDYELFRMAQAIVMNRDHVRLTSIHLKVITYLQSPYVMIRNITKDDGCNMKLYGCECYLFNQETKAKQKYCCFGISIDIINEIKKLKTYTNEYKQSLNGIKHAIVEITVLNPGSDGNSIKNSLNPDKYAEYKPLRHLMSSEADLLVGSHIIINKLYLNMSVLTKSYFATQVGLMIYRTEKLTGIMTFLYPFHWSMWVGIFITIQTVAIASTIYEWLSPYGQTPRGRNQKRIFSFSSGLTLCWSALFSHTVSTKSPKCWSSRFLMNVYACFCLIFLASYTAKLAAYMVGKNTTRYISGIHDPKITSGSYKLGTILDSGAHYHLQSAHKELFKYLRFYSNSDDCIEALRTGEIDVFIYDLEALQYFKKVYFHEQFEIVGKPFGQLLYTIAISKHLDKTATDLEEFISQIISNEFFHRNMFQRIRLWTKQITGIDSSAQWSSVRLRIHNFSGPLIIFSFAIIIAFFSLLIEQLAFKYMLPWVRKRYSTPWCLPLSQRFHRHISCEPFYKKETYTERHLPKAYSQNIGERLINHRKFSESEITDSHLSNRKSSLHKAFETHMVCKAHCQHQNETRFLIDKTSLWGSRNFNCMIKDASSQTDDTIFNNYFSSTTNMNKLQDIICMLIHENSLLSKRLSEIEN